MRYSQGRAEGARRWLWLLLGVTRSLKLFLGRILSALSFDAPIAQRSGHTLNTLPESVIAIRQRRLGPAQSQAVTDAMNAGTQEVMESHARKSSKRTQLPLLL